MQKDIASKTKSSLFWNTSLRFANQILRFGISIIIARILDPNDFGIMGIGTMVVFYANSTSNLGFSLALIQRKELKDSHIHSVFTLDLVISIILTAGTLLFAGSIADFFNTPEVEKVLWVLSPIFIITSFFQMPITLFNRDVNFKVTALMGFYRSLLQSGITLVLALAGFKYWALVLGLIISYAIATMYIVFKSPWEPRVKYIHSEMKEIFNFGFYNFARSQLSHFSEYADKFIIGKFLGTEMLGGYEKAFSSAAMIKLNFSQKVNAVMFSSFSRLHSEDIQEIQRYFKKSLALISLSTFPFCVGLALVGSHFVLVLFGSKWELMVVPLEILSLAFIFNCMTGLTSSLNVSVGDYKSQTIIDVICIVLLIIISMLLVSRGIEYIAAGVLFIYALMFLLGFRLSQKNINISLIDMLKSIFPALLSSIIMAAVVFYAKRMLFSDLNLMNLTALTGIGSLTYALAVLLPRYDIVEDYRSKLIRKVKDFYRLRLSGIQK